jgi:hypothetical protein
MSKQIPVTLSDDAANILEEIKDYIKKSELRESCTNSHAITKALIALKDKIDNGALNG